MLSTIKQHSKSKKSPSHNTKTRKMLPSWYSDSLPKVKRATTRKRSKSPHSKNPFNKPLNRLKQKAEQAINKGIFFPLVLILNGKIIVLLK